MRHATAEIIFQRNRFVCVCVAIWRANKQCLILIDIYTGIEENMCAESSALVRMPTMRQKFPFENSTHKNTLTVCECTLFNCYYLSVACVIFHIVSHVSHNEMKMMMMVLKNSFWHWQGILIYTSREKKNNSQIRATKSTNCLPVYYSFFIFCGTHTRLNK